MDGRGVETALSAGLSFAVLGVVAWATGAAFVFPSLGPSAFVLAFAEANERPRGATVVGGHVIGAVAGLLAYSLLAPGVALTASIPAFSVAGLRLVASGIVSVGLTSWGMVAADTVHAPACATTLIVSLGLLSSPMGVGIIVVSVVVLVAAHEVGRWTVAHSPVSADE
ncbi:HPP family protein [Haloferax sp. MBLA0076]|uniref:HPP family protein n=1 Tax=Haloferax litoreum TaxID=2666140 RepID=A0A6A8GFC8_9EURY|nr:MULTISPECIES: HPP family protein [Haloferax]KAB1193578.1 HPP family protein [Haloferax sp. CBA1148]MRX22094.1 HPP family protein [Haloferax litoreum]